MFFVYFFPLLGGFLADRFLGYGRTIGLGLVVMFIGYILMALPSAMGKGFGLVIAALTVIALGTGLFKGNLQALVGNLYDDPKYGANRDRAFNIFYMGINIGAMFAPTAADKVSNWILSGRVSSTTPGSRPWPTASSRERWPTPRSSWASRSPRIRRSRSTR